MNQTFLSQLLSLAGLIGAVGAYAGLLRRRRDARAHNREVEESNWSAVERVARLRALGEVAKEARAGRGR